MPDAAEVARTALATLRLPEVAALRPHLQPEVPVFARDGDGSLVAARVDAIVARDGQTSEILDWKGDTSPSARDHAGYVAQVRAYMAVIGAKRGAIVYMSAGKVVWITPDGGHEIGLHGEVSAA